MALVSRFTKSNQNPVGMIVSSMLTEAQYQALNGTSWILADGRSVAGSSYASVTGNSTVPDLRGQVLRGKNNSRSDGQQDPAGELTLGTQQADQMQGHRHNVGSGLGGSNVSGQPFVGNITNPSSDPISDGTNGTPRTGAETRVKSVIVNHFIKINP